VQTAVDDVDDAAAAALGRLAIRQQPSPETLLPSSQTSPLRVDDAVAAGLVRFAVGRAAAAGVVGARFRPRLLFLSTCRCAARSTCNPRAAVAIDDAAVVAHFPGDGVDDAVTAQPLDAHRLLGGALGSLKDEPRTLHADGRTQPNGGAKQRREEEHRAWRSPPRSNLTETPAALELTTGATITGGVSPSST
jgi:hypothetical protein